ncbi:MAG: rRNA maturation RNAse YbeY [Parcubacteria group bacterium]|nr:rRNA maturation RNAse YbeY [Parcubacteria group bacterium]
MMEVRNLTGSQVPRGFFRLARKLFLLLKLPPGVEVSVVLAEPPLMKQLNRKYRGKEGFTNVLSFGASHAERKEIIRVKRGLLGEIFLCPRLVPGYRRQTSDFVEAARTERAEALIHSTKLRVNLERMYVERLTHLLLHAILHLQGYTHALAKDARVMEKREKVILKKLLKS